MLTIPLGHALAAVQNVLGPVTELSAVLATRRASALAIDTSETLPLSPLRIRCWSAVGYAEARRFRSAIAAGPPGMDEA